VSSTEEAPADRLSPRGTEVAVDRITDDDTGADGDIGWVRAIASGLVVLLVGFGAGLGSANAILTKALGLTRDARQWLATALFLVVVIVLAWALRWLQGRGWI
jgi:F0F1-type ATP synthase membrane subunit c/vacuolar-type H+-ATPase subunit K